MKITIFQIYHLHVWAEVSGMLYLSLYIYFSILEYLSTLDLLSFDKNDL